jgi:hypothetical protein
MCFFLQILELTPRRELLLLCLIFLLASSTSFALFFMIFSLSSFFSLLFVCIVQVFF